MFFDSTFSLNFASYSICHSMLASVVLDLPKVKNESKIIGNLRDTINSIIENSKSGIKLFEFKSPDISYQKYYCDMIKHLLVSINNLPSNINVNSVKKVKADLTYSISYK